MMDRPEVVVAGRAACAMAGIEQPARQIDVAEIHDAFTGAELQGIEALGPAPEGEAGADAHGGIATVSPTHVLEARDGFWPPAGMS
jgi:acetyl-CoA acetyltransferase